ncbi:MAG: hypothetical protein LBP80_01870 [Treponema sp.]|jgi:hypothetical protein|nr:hypothetical protein [Treponema sp.]
MKKPVAPRIAGLLVLYLGVFTFLVALQFSSRRDFTRHVGAMTISGHYEESVQDDGTGADLNEFQPEGDLSVSFGGMEFRVTGPGGDFAFLRSGGNRESPAILALVIERDSAVVRFAEAGDPQSRLELIFNSRISSGRPELRITGSFGGDYTGFEIPFRPLRSTRIQNMLNGDFTVTAEGSDFAFVSSRLDMTRRMVIADAESSAVVYRSVSGENDFSPADYVLPEARTIDQYADQISQWRNQVFAAWNRTPTASLDNEELVTAYIADAVHRGVYREVVSRIPRSFLDSSRRTYASSPFFGRLAQNLRSLSAAEQERVSRLTESEAAEFFVEPHVIAENAVRGNDALVDRGIALLSALEEPALDLVPPILEAVVDLAAYRDGDNSLDHLVEPSLSLIVKSLKKDEANNHILVFGEDGGELAADAEFNLRLGAALDQYGRFAGREDWAAAGRSLVLSVLAQTDTVSMIPQVSTLSAGGVFIPKRDPRFSAARLYRYLRSDNYPHAERIAGGINGWAWTAASSVSVTQNGDITDIAVSFPAGETHYMMLRGIKPFTKIQLYGIDYRTDPQFERYDSSGWSYSSPDQTLLLKVKHQNPVEHIVIHTAAPPAPRPAPRPASPEPAGENAAAEVPGT